MNNSSSAFDPLISVLTLIVLQALMVLPLVATALLTWACFVWWRRLCNRSFGTLALSFFGSTVVEAVNFAFRYGEPTSVSALGKFRSETWLFLQYGWGLIGPALLVAGAVGLLTSARGLTHPPDASFPSPSPGEPPQPPPQP